jgi:phosphopentomutase
VLVADACGVGALPDAGSYGDEGTNTLAHLAEATGGLRLPMLASLGLGCIVELKGVPAVADPAIHGRLHALGPGKDSITGHWELMGVVAERALPTYPQGLPHELLARLQAAIGRPLICNRPCNGIAAIEQFGAQHLQSGALIAYTSQDSVLQLAAHVELVPTRELYRACETAREVMHGEDAVARVIARPFKGREGSFARTPARRDFTLLPPSRSYLQELSDAGVPVHAVGKIADLFAGQGITRAYPGADNAQALRSADAALDDLEGAGLVFANLIDTDQNFGHRKDVAGFAHALRALDDDLAMRVARMRAQDLLVVTADHGVDPAHPGTDHTREYAPLLAVTGAMLSRSRGRHARAARRHDGPLADVGASVLRWLAGRDAPQLPGRAFVS